MVMETLQIRLPKDMLNGIDTAVKRGIYSSRSDFIRDLVRRHYLSQLVGILPYTGDYSKETRNKLSKQIKSFKDIEKINQDPRFQ